MEAILVAHAMAAADVSYGTFRVLLDEPADTPLLGFDAYATAFADTIEHSKARFAVGIFGSWGSGKTTLMRAIEAQLRERESIIPVWFNAWRYEREEHLIVPLLDTLRDELDKRAVSEKLDAGRRERAKAAAGALARAARAISRGLKLRVSVPLTGIGADFDVKAIEDAFTGEPPTGPNSFYHRSFTELEAAMKEFAAGGAERIVVFIDDLDRCLPLNALTVLESMKLFFDLEGFVFVVGLDQDVIQRSIEQKYGTPADRVIVLQQQRAADGGGSNGSPPPPPGASEAEQRAGPVSGAEYIKKIFQVPFGLPRISVNQLQPFFDGLVEGSGLPDEQKADLGDNVSPHLRYLSGESAVNPREIKRLINAYTLQMKLLSARGIDPLEPHAVLALLTLSFRTEWRPLYDRLVTDPASFAAEIRGVLDADAPSVRLWPGDQPIPAEFREYLRTQGRALFDVDLETYISSVEATRSSRIELGPAQALVVDLGRIVSALRRSEPISQADYDRLSGSGERLRETLTYLPSSLPAAGRAARTVERVQSQWPPPADATAQKEWADGVEPLLHSLYDDLRQIRLLSDVGGHAAA